MKAIPKACLLLTYLLFWPTGPLGAGTTPPIVTIGLTPRAQDHAPAARLVIDSDAGITNQIQYSGDLGGTNWLLLTNVLVVKTPYAWIDESSPSVSARFYRVLAQDRASEGSALVPGGEFVMGDALGTGHFDEVPVHTNFVTSFQIDKDLVTAELWEAVYGWAITNGYQFDNEGSAKDTNHPIVLVSWYDALKWCNARSEKEALMPAYWTTAEQTNVYRSGVLDPDPAAVKWDAGYRLPTEAEWEKAARGGATGHDYPWRSSNEFSNAWANVLGNEIFAGGPYPFTSPVGYFPANGYGLNDMAGNVWEWCWDWYQSDWYASIAALGADTRGPETGDFRVLRGGSWNDDPGFARCAQRGFDSASAAFNFYGFRCVKGF